MKVKLIDLDSKMPNLALMQLSAYHKSLGDTVGFDVNDPDKVYISCIFDKNREQAYGLKVMYPDADIDIGGSGVDLKKKLPIPNLKIYPDYELYPYMNYSLGFTTKGCIRKCPFCIVPTKEGKLHRWQHVSEWYNPKFKDVYFLDNNMYADKDWFFDNTDFIIENKLRMSVPQGFDIRILTEEIAKRLTEIKLSVGKNLNFAFDNVCDENAVRNGIEILKQMNIDLHHKVMFCVLTGFNTTPEEDIYRVNILRELGTCPFIMQYKPNRFTKMLAHYCNRKNIFYKTPLEEYKPYLKWKKYNE